MISTGVLSSMGATSSEARSGSLNAHTGRLVVTKNGMTVAVGRAVEVGLAVGNGVVVGVDVEVEVGVAVVVGLAVSVGVVVGEGELVTVGVGDGSPKAKGNRANVNWR